MNAHTDTHDDDRARCDALHPPSASRLLQQDRDDLALRFSRLLGDNWRKILASAVDVHVGSIRRTFNPPTERADFPGAHLYALAEFLEQTAPSRWPKRWRR